MESKTFEWFYILKRSFIQGYKYLELGANFSNTILMRKQRLLNVIQNYKRDEQSVSFSFGPTNYFHVYILTFDLLQNVYLVPRFFGWNV